jgi:hypothetical protein
VYDFNSEHTNQLDFDRSHVILLLKKLAAKYQSVSFLTGGLLDVKLNYPHLCSTTTTTASQQSQTTTTTTTTTPSQSQLKLAASATTNLINLKPKQIKFTHSLSTYDIDLCSTDASPLMSNSSTSANAKQQSSSSLANSSIKTSLSVTSLLGRVNSQSTGDMSSSVTSVNAHGGGGGGGCSGECSDAELPKVGPTEILSFLYLGSQDDALSEATLKHLNITNILNVSATCPKPDFIEDAHFLRISKNDGHGEKILPFFDIAFRFIGKLILLLLFRAVVIEPLFET